MKQRIQQRLDELGYSARHASLETDLSDKFLQRILSEDDPSMQTKNLLKLAETLKTTPEWILTGRTPGQGPAEAAELVSIYLEMNEAERTALVEYARWRLNSQK
ncbi:MAG: hypothetical protein AAFW60_02875 [Pseudomonadota bacterium]